MAVSRCIRRIRCIRPVPARADGQHDDESEEHGEQRENEDVISSHERLPLNTRRPWEPGIRISGDPDSRLSGHKTQSGQISEGGPRGRAVPFSRERTSANVESRGADEASGMNAMATRLTTAAKPGADFRGTSTRPESRAAR